MFYNHYSRIIKSIKNYSFALSRNNLSIIPREKSNETNKILLCDCKKYKENQKNGILLTAPDPKKNEPTLTQKFYETENFEVLCFCPILNFIISMISEFSIEKILKY